MKFQQYAGLCLMAFSSLAASAVVPAERVEKRAESSSKASTSTSSIASLTSSEAVSSTSLAADSSCKHGPYTRACWNNGYSIATDFDQKFPTTGNTVTYNLEITNGTCNPDGNGDRLCLLINNQYPGPTIRATWGDQLVINVKNSMQDNGTSMHWHGVRQYHSPGSDGVNGLSECALAPGDSRTYSFQVTQFGTSWYHSHFSSQYGDGVVGTIIFDGPATANYDVDLGVYTLSDWYYITAFQMDVLTLNNLQVGGPPPNADNILINGTNKNANGGGQYGQVTITNGKKYRLRLINTSVDNYIRVSLDSHVMTVMTSDFIPIKPFSVETLLVGIGQRYDVVINANQTAGNYWFRANVATDCLSANNFYGQAIWSYSSVTAGTPTSSQYSTPSDCSEPSGIAPYWVQPVPSGTFETAKGTFNVGLTEATTVPNGDAVVVWALGNQSMNADWEQPTLQYLMNGNTNYTARMNVYDAASEGNWNYWVVQMGADAPPVPHPIHLHGHDFFVLGQGSGTFSSSSPLNYATPPRRDTATLPGNGWLALAFSSNNPGAWLMHCHIAWHVSEGLALQWVEEPSQITWPSSSAMENTCSNWATYSKNAYYQKIDSGL